MSEQPRPRLKPWHVLLLCFALASLSQAGNLVRLAEAPVLAIAFYRLFGGLLFTAPLGFPQILRHRGHRELAAMFLGGLFFGAHFLAWFWGVKHTTVANGMLLFAANPVFAALGGWLILGERVKLSGWAAIGLGLVGIACTTGGDLSLRPERLAGDALSLASGILFAGYIVCGRFYRRALGVWGAFSGTLAAAAVVVGVLIPIFSVPLGGYSGQTWLALGLLVLFPTLIGHGVLNYSMRFFPAAVLSGLTLTEPLLGGIVAWLLFHEGIHAWSWLGYALIVLSAIMLLRDQVGQTPPSSPAS